jgi:CheY-like chemotaxis protein
MDAGETTNVPDDFLEQVKSALGHLYDFPYLQNSTLAQQMFGKYDTGESVGLNFRRTLIECIESINPGEDLLYRSPDGNVFNLLRYYYIDRMTLNEAQIELGISERQSYRVLKRGQISVAELLWIKYEEITSTDTHYPIEQELVRLRRNIQTFDLRAVLDLARQSVESLAKLNEKEIIIASPQKPMMVTSIFPITQQTLILLLSFSIKNYESRRIEVALEQDEQSTTLTIFHNPTNPDLANLLEQSTLSKLIHLLGWEFSLADDAMTIEIRIEEFTILVIDDNEELSELINRFLINKPYHVIFSTSGKNGLRQAREADPDIIVLDIMMPEMNGWEILQRLRTEPHTEHIPVIICSVINDPELAYSLNASHVLVKPINQEKLIAALDEIIAGMKQP